MKAVLLKPWSIWTTSLTQDCKNENIIARFYLKGEMWKEFEGCIFGISNEQMNILISNKYAKIFLL
jgi:hypothetical protein